MASIIYPMVLILFAFGAFCSVISTYGGYDMPLPVTGLVMGEDEARNLQKGALEQPTSEYNWVEILRMFMAALGEGILLSFSVIPLLVTWGVPLPWAAGLSSPQAWVIAHSLWDYWLQRPPE